MTRVVARGAIARAGEIITFDTSTVIEHRQLPTTPPLAPGTSVRDNLPEHIINPAPEKTILGKH